MKISVSPFLLLGAVLALTACDSVRQELGLGRNPPDEFAVVDRAPLSVPPDFALRPPRPGAPRPQEVEVTSQAKQSLFGEQTTGKSAAHQSGGEKDLLTALGADKADPAIRQQLDREATQRVDGDKHLIQELLWWKNNTPEGVAVDADAEAARIKAAKEKGEPVGTGATPIITRDKSGWLGL